MANSDWTKEERERAAEDLTRSQEDNGCNPSVYSIGGYGYEVWAIDLQCSLNRLQEEVREARRIIQLAEPVAGIENNVFYGWCKDWLSRNK